MPDTASVTSLRDIPGWFTWTDQQLFRYFLGQAAPDEPGHLVELGVYLGKSAALVGDYLRPGERFVVCDLFNASSDAANNAENARSYRDLTREAFEQNYLALHSELPEIIQAPSSVITRYVEPGTARFVHVDASHLYEHVVIDIDSAITMLAKGGIAVFDDFQSPHTPGVAAAVWAAVVEGRLLPVCVSRSKLYAVTSEPDPVRQGLMEWLATFGRLQWEVQQVAGAPLIRIWPPPSPNATPNVLPELREMQKRLDKRLRRIEKQLAQTNARLDAGVPERIWRAAKRRVARRRNSSGGGSA